MAVNTILLDFSVDPSLMKSDASLGSLSSNIEGVLKEFLAGLRIMNNFTLEDSLVKIFTADGGALVNLRAFKTGLITLNIDYFKDDKEEPLLSFEKCLELERSLETKVVEITRTQSLVPIKRGQLPRYFPSSDNRLLEYDIDELVFEQITAYQKVQIVHSKCLGNMLVLDCLQNIAESDLIYTETLMQRGKENYKDKEIVILGGGDGALLYELLKEQPKEVIMLEIDEVVMKACAKHLRSICGDVLDNYEGPRYKIIVGDCMKALEQYVKEGRTFDYVFGDLTDVPISEGQGAEEMWTFIDKVLHLSFKVLKPNGKFMSHLTGSLLTEAIDVYKEHLQKIRPPVSIKFDAAFVPSFLEEWAFCQVLNSWQYLLIDDPKLIVMRTGSKETRIQMSVPDKCFFGSF